MSITIAYNGFRGLYFHGIKFHYIINGFIYDTNLIRDPELLSVPVRMLNNWRPVPSFDVDPQGSQILALIFTNNRLQEDGNFLVDTTYMLYQKTRR